MRRSLSLRSNGSCAPGYHKRRSYTRKGHSVSARCVRSTTPYKESSATFKRRVTQRRKQRMNRYIGTRKACSSGKILRAAYIRRYATAVRQQGYTRKTKAGKVIRIVLKKTSPTLVAAACIKDRGKKGKGTQKIGPLREGELSALGYSTKKSRVERHAALRKAVKKFGPNNVFHKLDAVAKLSVRTAPDKSRIFSADRNWVRNQFGISAF